MMSYYQSTNFKASSAISETYNKNVKIGGIIHSGIAPNRFLLNHVIKIDSGTKLARADLKWDTRRNENAIDDIPDNKPDLSEQLINNSQLSLAVDIN